MRAGIPETTTGKQRDREAGSATLITDVLPG